MGAYTIWNGQDDIYQPDNKVYTKDEWIAKNPWLRIPGAKMIISTGLINGAVTMEFHETKRLYANMGANITDGMTDEEVLAAIQAFEETPQEAPVSAEERIAAALEFQAMLALPDEN